MRNALGLALLALPLSLALGACGDNVSDNIAIDAALIDAPIDAAIDARVCPVPAQGMVGGTCTTNAQCDSATGAGDGFCFNNLLGVAPWPAQGYCLSRIGGCTMDSQCGTGNVCVTLDPGTPDEISACMLGCAADPCACPDGMACTNGYAGTDVGRMVCVPANPGAIDGSPCSTFGDCDKQSICLADGFEAPGGQCLSLGCTLGNDTTCTAGGDGHCGPTNVLGGGTGCLDKCTTTADCRAVDGYVCFDAGGTTGKYCRHPATGDACAADGDCGAAAVWDCRTGVGFPGGYCTVQAACDATTGGGCSPGSSHCYDPAGPTAPYCIDRCTGVGQGTCRTGYVCTDINPSPTITTLGCIGV